MNLIFFRIFGDIKNSIYHPPTYFDNQYEDDWIIHPLSVEMIKDVDKSEVKSPHLIESPVLGPISPKEISGGVKTLILMAFDARAIFSTPPPAGITVQNGLWKLAEIKI